MKIGPLDFGLELIPPRLWSALFSRKFHSRSEYKPRIVHEVNLVVARLTLIDHRQVKRPSLSPGLALRPPDEFVQVRGLVWDGNSGTWRPATPDQVGTKVSHLLGVASQANA